MSLNAVTLRNRMSRAVDEEPRCDPCQTCGSEGSVLWSGEKGVIRHGIRSVIGCRGPDPDKPPPVLPSPVRCASAALNPAQEWPASLLRCPDNLFSLVSFSLQQHPAAITSSCGAREEGTARAADCPSWVAQQSATEDGCGWQSRALFLVVVACLLLSAIKASTVLTYSLLRVPFLCLYEINNS